MAVNSKIEDIFEQYRNRIYGLALSITRNEKDAEDILQNSFVKIISNIKNFRNQSRLSTWIYRIVYNEALMYVRNRSRRFKSIRHFKESETKIPSGLFINWSKLADAELLDKEFKERMDDAIGNLPIKYRMALLLHKFSGFSLKDTSRILNLKNNSLKTRLHRGLMMVKKDIAAYFKDKIQEKPPAGNKCDKLVNFIYDYALGEITKEQKNSFKSHIKDCRNCGLFLDNYLQAIRITKALECNDLPAELKDKVKTFILRNK